MDALQTAIVRLNVSSSEINSEVIQEVLIAVKKASILSEQSENFDIILEKLWNHLNNGLEEFDDQLLCSTCFHTILSKSTNLTLYLNKIFTIINGELQINNNNISLAISLCYGIFQSSFLTQDANCISSVLENLLKSIFKLLVKMSYEYTQHTFVVFKTMNNFQKVIGTPLELIIFEDANKIKILNLINHNWENPITGIRNLNRILFQTILQVFDKAILLKILDEVNRFYWNKAKYLMLTEIIHQYNGKIEEYVVKNGWLGGLLNSLHKPGLVSAGADMYYAILEKLHSDICWKTLFQDNVIKILKGPSFQAIENFNNYWCLNTFKKFPTLARDIIENLKIEDESELKLYSILCLLKQANKLALIGRNWTTTDDSSDEKNVLKSTDHCNAYIRMAAFEIICVSHQKCLPTQLEYTQILDFLRHNINSDCTVLRLSIIKNLDVFLSQLHNVFLNSLHKDDLKDLRLFCKEMQCLVIESLNFCGNYQRKIATVKVTYTILKCLSNMSRKKNKQSSTSKNTLLSYLKENNCWELHNTDFILKLVSLFKDPSNDVHEIVLQLLSDFYITEFNNTNLINYLVNEGLTCISSRFFYEISSGQNIFKLIICSLIETKDLINTEAKFKNLEEIFNFAYKEISRSNLNTDIVKSIEEGKQLHAYLGILYVIFDTALKSGYKVPVEYDCIISLIDNLEIISNQFAWEDNTLTSSDFSKMNDMVQNLINNSGCSENIQDQTKISGLHQSVLNCLWLNAKGACDLASLLILCFKDYVAVCEKCLGIMMHVLETSRHKGAIEAAGAALGQGIYYLTSSKLRADVSQLPFTLLEKKLNDLLFETVKMSSVTRRGAGLSIMVHRIVSNDKKKGKPLFHYFMRKLLKACKALDENCGSDKDLPKDTLDSDKDLPKAIYIHFLTRIVTDSSLASDIMYYSANLAELAFNNLTNSNWQIRNAALQLYGALIPKLIGQKKASGIDEETVATVGCDEFRTHSPELWTYILNQIKDNQSEDIVQTHSNLVPILNVLANIARRYNFSSDAIEQNKSESELLLNLTTLLGSPIHTVRRLTAKSIVNLYSFGSIYSFLKKNECFAENYFHGLVLLIINLNKIYSTEESLRSQLEEVIDRYHTILLKGKYSYICKWGIEKLLKLENMEHITIEVVEKTFLLQNTHRYEPGITLWSNTKVQKCLQQAPWNIVPAIINIIITCNEFENYCEILINKLEASGGNYKEILLEIAKILLSSNLTSRSSSMWKTLYIIALKTDLNAETLDVSSIHKYLNQVSYQMRYIIPFSTRFFAHSRYNENLLLLSNTIYLLCNPDGNNVEMRYIAAMANNELAYKFKEHCENVKVNAIKSLIILLQDEDEDVRNLSVNFYKYIVTDNIPKQPFICLNAIIDYKFLFNMFNQPELSIPKISKDLYNFTDNLIKNNGDNYNPFANDSKNIYLEVNVIKQLLLKLQKI